MPNLPNTFWGADHPAPAALDFRPQELPDWDFKKGNTMPTGYTYPVADGKVTEFREFAMQCARAFGACIMMRDEPQDAKIPDAFEPSDYHKKRLEETREGLIALGGMDLEDCDKAAREDYKKALDYHREYIDRIKRENARYYAMLEQVKQWEPPSEDHIEFKKFMVDQLETSVSACFSTAPTLKTAEQWRTDQAAKYAHDLEYHQQHWNEEVERTNQRNGWVRKLRESLEQVPA